MKYSKFALSKCKSAFKLCKQSRSSIDTTCKKQHNEIYFPKIISRTRYQYTSWVWKFWSQSLVCLFADRRTSGREHNKNGAASWAGNRRTPRGIKKSLAGQLLLFLSHQGEAAPPRIPQNHTAQSDEKKAIERLREKGPLGVSQSQQIDSSDLRRICMLKGKRKLHMHRAARRINARALCLSNPLILQQLEIANQLIRLKFHV